MSSSRRPWFPWYPKEYVADEKARGLSDDADLLYRRILDCMWEASAVQLPKRCQTIANQVARGWTQERFENAWDEMWIDGFELFKTTECGKFFYSERLRKEAQKIEMISKKKSESGKLGAKARAKQTPSKRQTKHKHPVSHPYPDIKKKIDKRKSQLPSDFKITDEMQSWFNDQNFIRFNAKDETEKFIDYWKSKGEPKKDWIAAWRNWMRKADEYSKQKTQETSAYHFPKCRSCGNQASNITKGQECPYCGGTA